MIDLFFVLVVLLVMLVIYLILSDVYYRLKPDYYGSMYYPRAKDVIPSAFDVLKIMKMNADEVFKYARDLALKHKRSWRIRVFNQIHLNVVRAKEAEVILSSTKHVNKNIMYHFIEPFVGDGLVTSNGMKWHARRKIITPTFHFNILQQFMSIFHEESDKMSQRLEIEIEKEEGTDMLPISTHFALNTICETAMGLSLDSVEGGSEYHKGLESLGKHIIYRLIHPWLYHDFMYKLLGYKRQLEKDIVPLHTLTRNVVNKRRNQFKNILKNNNSVEKDNQNVYDSKKPRYALLDTLLAAERKGLIDDAGVLEEVDTFMFTGHDTTTVGITFTFLLLANHKDIQTEIAEEARQTLAQSGAENLTKAEIENFKLLDRVVKESLRLYPPGSFISRALEDDLMFDNMIFQKGTLVHIHIFDIHRDPEVYPDPEKFDPDRFLPENTVNRHSYAYIPFSAGVRNCVGQKFAVLEMKSVITKILMKYELLPITKCEDVVFTADMILRSKYPIMIKFKLRD